MSLVSLGKSLQMVLEAREPVLICAPAMVLDSGTWDEELEKWAPGIVATQAAYTSLSGRVRTKGSGTKPTGRLRAELAQTRWGSKIGDESHHLSRSAHWTACFKEVRAEQTRLGTGTPINNWAPEAFSQLQLIWPEEAKAGRRLGSYWRWVAEWFHVGPTPFTQMAVGPFKDEAHLAVCPDCQGPARTWTEFQEEAWGDRMLLRLRDECLDLPPLTVQQMLVTMKGPQAKAYQEIQRDFVTWLENGKEIPAWNTAAQTTQLAKAATGVEVLADGVKGSAKLDALCTLLADRPRPTLVVAHFRRSVEACARVAGEAGAQAAWVHGGSTRTERRERVRAFKKGNLQVLCASIDLIAEGMNLHTSGADQVIRVERHARPSKNEQVLRRLHRLGTERPVLAVDLVTKGTWDQRILRLLEAKTDQQMLALGVEDLRRLGGGT